jgi:hypothetical protein
MDTSMAMTSRPPVSASARRAGAGADGPAVSSRADRGSGVLAAILLAILCALATALLPAPAAADPLPLETAVYGVGEDNNIYLIDPQTGAVTGTTSTASLGLTGNLANAFALDRDKAQVYFMANTATSSNSLYFWDRPSNTLGQIATATDLGVTSMPRNASFYEGRFWFIEPGDNLLRSATINYTSGLPASITLASPLTITGVTGGLFLNPNDIAIDPLTQTLYGSDTIVANNGTGDFFSISLANLGGPLPYTKLYDQPTISDKQVGVQLAFDQIYGTLYGQDYESGAWFTVGTTVSGSFTPTGGVSAAGFRMRDLAGGVQPVPEPETIALAATGILMGGVMIYRDRSRRRRRRDGLMVSDELPAAALMPA